MEAELVKSEEECCEWASDVNPAEKDSKAHVAVESSFSKLLKQRKSIAVSDHHFPYDQPQCLLTYHALIAHHFGLMHRAQEYLQQAHPNHDFSKVPSTDVQACHTLIAKLPDTAQTEIRKAYIAFCNSTANGYRTLYQAAQPVEKISAALSAQKLWGETSFDGVTKLIAEYAQTPHFAVWDFRTLLRNRTDINFVGIGDLTGIGRLSNENRTLENLSFIGNHLTEIAGAGFGEFEFPALKSLHFASNQITGVPASVLTSCPNLWSLVLSGNPIEKLSPEFCTAVAKHPKLTKLFMIRCPLNAESREAITKACREAITKACGEKVELLL